ncbi:hypothetical protein TNCV_1419501 [Trichonephila clavipes]|nr:hypothetical protein TNCV_1419501 [Trichonephila clavipes]
MIKFGFIEIYRNVMNKSRKRQTWGLQYNFPENHPHTIPVSMYHHTLALMDGLDFIVIVGRMTANMLVKGNLGHRNRASTCTLSEPLVSVFNKVYNRMASKAMSRYAHYTTFNLVLKQNFIYIKYR